MKLRVCRHFFTNHSCNYVCHDGEVIKPMNREHYSQVLAESTASSQHGLIGRGAGISGLIKKDGIIFEVDVFDPMTKDEYFAELNQRYVDFADDRYLTYIKCLCLYFSLSD